jgi:acetyl esterase/lipase
MVHDWNLSRLLTALSMLVASAGIAPVTHAFSLERLFNAVVSERAGEVTQGVPFGLHNRQRLDVYRAPVDRERAPILVFFYGGSWKEGSRGTYAFVGSALAARGYTTVIPDYRLFPEVSFPAFLDDAAAAYRWVATNIANSCGTTRPVIVVGHSAGAYIAAMMALDEPASRDGALLPRPAALIGLAGPYAFDPTTWPSTRTIFAPAAGKPDTARPLAFVRPGAPLALLLHGGDDDTVQLYNSRDLAAALNRQKSAATLIEYPGIGHVGLVLAMAQPLRWRAPVLSDMIAFIERHHGTARAPACPGASRKRP